MDIRNLLNKISQLNEATDLKSIPEAKKKKPDADGDGVPDWADKKPGKDDNEDKKEVKEDADPETKAAHSKGAADAARGITKNPYNPGSPLAAAYEEGQQSYKRNFGEGLEEGEMASRKGDKGETIRVHKAKAGGYGRKIDKDDESGDKFHSSDIDDTDDAPAQPAVKRGRGRPVKNANSDTGEAPKFDTKAAQALQSYVVGNLTKNKPGKTSHVNRLKEHMEQVEAQMITEGKMSEVAAMLQDIASGEIDIYDIISGKYVPVNKVEEFVAKKLKDKFEEYTRFTKDDGGPDAMDKIHSELEDILSGRGSLEEVAIGGTGAQTAQQQPAGTTAPASGQADTTSTQQQPAKVMANGRVVGTAPTSQAASQATPIMTRMKQDQASLSKLGVTPVQESLADTMNKFAQALTESGSTRTKRVLSEGINDPLPQLVMEGTLEEILQVFPHEHKMCQEGWGMDEGMFEALCDHYHRDGRIPRKVWHGPMEELRKCVEECYMQDTQTLMGETDVEEGAIGSAVGSAAGEVLGAEAGPLGSAVGGAIGGAIGDKVGDMFDENAEVDTVSNPYNASATPIKGITDESHDLLAELDEELDKVLNKENAMFESKKPSAGMSAKEKSAVAKKAQAGGDIGKPGKGFEKVAAKAAKEYGSKEKGEKVAAAAMWKNAAHRASESIEEATDEEQIAHDLGAHKRKLAREKNRAEINSMMSAEHPTKASGAKEQARIGKYNREIAKPEVVGGAMSEAKESTQKRDSRAEKAGKKVTKDIEWDEKHKIKESDYDSSGAYDKWDPKHPDFAKNYKKYQKSHAGATLKDYIASLKKTVKESYDFSLWDQQLSQLIEGKQPQQPQQISESARSITKRQQINEAGLADLFAMLKNAGMQAPAQAPAEVEVDIESDPEQNTAAYRDGSIYDGTGSPALTTQTPGASNGDDPHSKTDDASDVPVMAMPRGMGMSQNTDGVESHVVEPVMSDEVIDHLQSGAEGSDDSGDSALEFIKKTMNHGETPVAVVQTQTQTAPQGGGDYEDEVAEDNEPAVSPRATGGSPSPMANKQAQSMEVQEDDVEEGNAFSGAVAKAKADGIQKGEKITVGGKTYPVKEEGEINPNSNNAEINAQGEAAQDNAAAEYDKSQANVNEADHGDASDSISSILKKLEKLGQMMSDHKKKDVKEGDDMNMVANRHSELELDESKQECSECGGMYEGESHKCDENLTEWANTPSQLIDEETFETDVDFMTRGISGGLNNQKQDQTLVGSGPNRVVTQTEREDVAQSMGALLKRLGGIN